MSAVAARTTTIRVGTAVVLSALRSSFLSAHALASLDLLSRGRLTVGVGAGFPMPTTEAEFSAAEARFDQRVGRLVETVKIWRALWSSQNPIDYQGNYHQLSAVQVRPGPEQPGGPPLFLAGPGPRALRRAGRVLHGWLPYPHPRDLR